jgi:hypothetical protein
MPKDPDIKRRMDRVEEIIDQLDAEEVSLEDFGADVDHRDRDSRLDRPEPSEFGVDDRPEVEHSEERRSGHALR